MVIHYQQFSNFMTSCQEMSVEFFILPDEIDSVFLFNYSEYFFVIHISINESLRLFPILSSFNFTN